MKVVRSYRRRGSPDLPIAVYLNSARDTAYHPNPEYHPETEIVLVVEGTVLFQLDGVSTTYRKDDIFIIPGNGVHLYQAFSEDAILCSLIFSTDALATRSEHYFQTAFVEPFSEGRLLFPPLLQPGHPAYDAIRTQLNILQKERMYDKLYKMIRYSCLISICSTLYPYCRDVSGVTPPSSYSNETVRQCLRFLHNNYTQKITMERLSVMFHLHPNYLSTLFKKHTGQTIFEYLNRFRIETATQLLKKEDLPVSKVGDMVGFSSESLFYRKFREFTGMTPKAYQKQHKNKIYKG